MIKSISFVVLMLVGLELYSDKISYPMNFNMPILIDGKALKGLKPIKGAYLFMSETEVSNQQYHEFIGWMKANNAPGNAAIYPDTNVWGKGFEGFKKHYFQSPAFANMPVVGISQEQARMYCQWIENQLNTHFKNNPKSKIKKLKVRLPSEQEWTDAANSDRTFDYNFPWTCEGIRYCGPEKKHIGKYLLNCKMGTISYETIAPYNTAITTEVYSYWPNDYGLYNMSGNVAEWIEENGLSKGGSWSTTPFNCRINYAPQYMPQGSASSSIGFRYVVEIIETYDEVITPFFEIKNKLVANGFEYLTKVNNTDHFKFMSNEVSNLLYKQFLLENKDSAYRVKLGIWKTYFRYTYFEQYAWHSAFNEFPVVGISYESANAFCKWLETKYNQNPKRDYQKVVFRLPTEVEWMHAAHAGGDFQYGSSSSYLRNSKGCYLANFSPLEEQYLYQDSNNVYSWINNKGLVMNRSVDGALIPHHIRSYFPNNFGLYNCSGNVAEMIDEKGTSKGGSWVSTQYELMIISKEKYYQANAALGFRVIAEVMER